MHDKIEKYIKDHRHQLDEQTPPEDAWKNIEANLRSTAKPNYLRYWQAAAVIFFIISIGLVINNSQFLENEVSVAESILEFKTTEEYYLDVIENQQGLLTSYLQQYPDLANDFKTDLKELSLNYTKLKKDFDTTGDSEVLNALIRNLQLQQDLLRNQLEIIKQIEQKNENVSI